MSETRYVAGVDTSTQSCKVVITDASTGEIIRQGRASHPDGTEIDPSHWWDAFLEAVEAAGGLADVSALSVAGQQHGMVCLDENGEVIRPALLWNDTRSAEAAEELIAELGDGDTQLGKERWANLTGSVPVASLTVTKLRWLADHEPENAARIRAICLPHDWLTWKIQGAKSLGALVTDRSDASGTGYMSRLTSEYLPQLLGLALRRTPQELDNITLPSILGPWESAGHGDPDRGWSHIRIGPGCGDNAGAALGIGLTPGEAMVSLGTSGVAAVVSPHSTEDPSGLVTGFADASGNWLPLACTLNASRIIDAICSLGGFDYTECDALALSVPDAAGLTLVPYFEGERTPNLPDATATLSGMTLANSDQAHLARAGIEGLLTLMRGALDAVTDLTGPVRLVHIVGGGAKSTAVQELAPEFLGAPVNVPHPGEYVALGAAAQAAKVLESAR
ncbi:xylulose kinase [Actinomycetaceae bacterium WB03_NA08]|uniref:Xylulose kinase n=1 Tax=Scrofimicrobium canadense TaxID=2652290 RepID=A0A6N7W6P0_9ACTO|nr:FGGY family carbohydrate kinase [Scrofimicrobium canadense]MSS85051.1 xylulose kinase [Scrofimicrobium canadense]